MNSTKKFLKDVYELKVKKKSVYKIINVIFAQKDTMHTFLRTLDPLLYCCYR